MYTNRRNKLTKKRLSLIIIVTIVLLSISFYFTRKITFIENGLHSISNFLNETLFYPIKLYNVQKDVDQSESYLIQKNVNESLEKEIQELKKELELKRTLTEYNTVNATILSRNKMYWFNTLVIDKGSKDGLKESMAVITKDGLVGKISKVYKSSSEVKLITSDDTNYKVSVSIKINDNESIAILNGYDAQNNLVKVTGVNKNDNVNVGDTVLTSGLGGVFPGGIYIGKVEKIESDKYNLSKTVHIKTYQNFNDIHYVTVLKVK